MPNTAEAELVLDLCRPSASSGALEHARQLLQRQVDWGRVFDHATRHRVLPTVWSYLDRLGRGGIPQMHRHLARAVVLYNAQRSEAMAREFRAIRAAFADQDLPVLIRKGIYLAWMVYPDPAWRYMTDFDFLVRRSDLTRLKEVMHGLGYRQGAISADHRQVKPIRREVEAFWLINTSRLPSFVRPTSDPSMRVFSVDLRFHVLEPAAGRRFEMDGWFERSRHEWILGAPTPVPSREDLLIDVCVHLYREAITLTTVETGRDLILSKFVDVAEILASPVAPDLGALVAVVRELGLESEVWYALRHTESLLPGAVPPVLLAELDPGDDTYLDVYGTLDGEQQTWRDPITVRAFDYGRAALVAGRSRVLRSAWTAAGTTG